MPTIEDYKKAYDAAKARGDKAGMAAAHAGAEAIRASQGYSGGPDGSQRIPLSSSSSSRSSTNDILERMKRNSEAWHYASLEERKRLEAENQALGKQAGLTYNPSTGTWSRPDGSNAYMPRNYLQQEQDQINQLYDQQRAARLAALNAAREKALGQINLQRQAIKPEYQQLRSQADVRAAQNAQKLREIMAAQGLMGSGENVTANIALQAERGQALNDLNLQEQQRYAELDQRARDLYNAEDEQAITAAIEADRAKELMAAQQRAQELARLNEQTAWERAMADREARLKEQSLADEKKLQELKNALAIAELTGVYNGQPTLQALLTGSQVAKNQAQGQASLLRATKTSTTKDLTPYQQFLIDKYKTEQDAKLRAEAIDYWTRVFPGGTDDWGKPRNNFARMTPAKQEQLINQYITMRSGATTTKTTTKKTTPKKPSTKGGAKTQLKSAGWVK